MPNIHESQPSHSHNLDSTNSVDLIPHPPKFSVDEFNRLRSEIVAKYSTGLRENYASSQELLAMRRRFTEFSRDIDSGILLSPQQLIKAFELKTALTSPEANEKLNQYHSLRDHARSVLNAIDNFELSYYHVVEGIWPSGKSSNSENVLEAVDKYQESILGLLEHDELHPLFDLITASFNTEPTDVNRSDEEMDNTTSPDNSLESQKTQLENLFTAAFYSGTSVSSQEITSLLTPDQPVDDAVATNIRAARIFALRKKGYGLATFREGNLGPWNYLVFDLPSEKPGEPNSTIEQDLYRIATATCNAHRKTLIDKGVILRDEIAPFKTCSEISEVNYSEDSQHPLFDERVAAFERVEIIMKLLERDQATNKRLKKAMDSHFTTGVYDLLKQLQHMNTRTFWYQGELMTGFEVLRQSLTNPEFKLGYVEFRD